MHDFAWSFIGGILLGISAVGYLYTNGRIAGISGLVSQVLNLKGIINTPALWFLLGLFIVPFIYAAFVQPEIYIEVIYAELSGDFPLGDSRQPTYKSLRPFDLVS